MADMARINESKLAEIREQVREAIAAKGIGESWLGPRSNEISMDLADGTKVSISVAGWERIA